MLRRLSDFAGMIATGVRSWITGTNPNTKNFWDKRLGGLNESWRDSHYHLITDLLEEDEGFSLLDVGCALGDGCEFLDSKFPKAEISGADFSEAGIEKARRKNKDINYILLDILKDEIPKSYDYITLIETLEHFDDPYIIVDKCLKSVKQALIITVPYRQNLALTFGEHRYRFDKDTFSEYNCETIKTTGFMRDTACRCIVYSIRPM